MAEARRVRAPGRGSNQGQEAGGRGGDLAARGDAPARPVPSAGARGAFQVRELIAEALAEWGLVAVWVEGDGNCLFRALSMAGVGDESQHQKMRAGVCQYMMSGQGRRRLGVAVGGWDRMPAHVR